MFDSVGQYPCQILSPSAHSALKATVTQEQPDVSSPVHGRCLQKEASEALLANGMAQLSFNLRGAFLPGCQSSGLGK